MPIDKIFIVELNLSDDQSGEVLFLSFSYPIPDPPDDPGWAQRRRVLCLVGGQGRVMQR